MGGNATLSPPDNHLCCSDPTARTLSMLNGCKRWLWLWNSQGRIVTVVSKSPQQLISPFYSPSCRHTEGWVLPVLSSSFLGVVAARFSKHFVLFMCPQAYLYVCIYACHTNLDVFANYLIWCGQEFIPCQYSRSSMGEVYSIYFFFNFWRNDWKLIQRKQPRSNSRSSLSSWCNLSLVCVLSVL